MLVLVVDDEPQIRKLLQTGLTGYGYQVITAANGQEALTAVAQRQPNVIILDIALGSDPDGLVVCQRLREWSQTPIIMLSVRGSESTKVAALDAGADDYLTKPFGMEELRARIQAVLRRTAVEQAGTAVLHIGSLTIDLANRRVTRHGQEIHFTPIEYGMLRLLVTHPGKIITHQTLLAQVWGTDYQDMTHYTRIYVNQIRKKLGENPATNERYIITEPGIGYRFIDLNS